MKFNSIETLTELVAAKNNVTTARAEELVMAGNVKVTDKLLKDLAVARFDDQSLWTVSYEKSTSTIIANFVDGEAHFMINIGFNNWREDGVGYLISLNKTQLILLDPDIRKDIPANTIVEFEVVKDLVILCLKDYIIKKDAHGVIYTDKLIEYGMDQIKL